MRILFVTHNFLPYSSTGVENYTLNTALQLQQMRHDVLVFSSIFDPLREDLEKFHYDYKGVRVEAFYHNLSSSSFIETFISLQKEQIFSDLISSFRPDIVHIQHLMFHSTGYLKGLRERGIPAVLTLHDFYYYCPNLGQRLFLNRFMCNNKFPLKCAICFRTSDINVHRLDTVIYRNIKNESFLKKVSERLPEVTYLVKGLRLLRRSPTVTEILLREKAMLDMLGQIDVIISPSIHFKQFFERYCGHPNIVHLDYGFNTSIRKAGKGRKTSRLRLGFVGTISRHKGAHLLIEIAKRFAESIEILIYGNDQNDRVLSRRIKSFPAVKYKGVYRPEEIKEVYNNIDYLIVPSIWEENSPLVIHEALLFDTPVIASARGGNSELIIEGRNGFLFDPDNPDSLFQLLERIIRDRIRLRDIDKSMVVSIDEHIKSLLNIYGNLTKSKC